MRRSFAEARRVLKPGAPLVCVYAHRTTEGWATLIRALVDAGMTVTEAWPVQTGARKRVNALGAAALSDSIFFVARRRQVPRLELQGARQRRRARIGDDSKPAPLIDVVHRLLWLLDNRPAGLPAFLRSARPNTEQLRLVTQALCAPVLGGPKAQGAEKLPAELGALDRLNANWRAVVEGEAFTREVETRVTGQGELMLESDGR